MVRGEKLQFLLRLVPLVVEGRNDIVNSCHPSEFKDLILKFPLTGTLFTRLEPLKDSGVLRKSSICNSCVVEGARGFIFISAR